MATSSFGDISSCTWPSVAAFQQCQATIQNEVEQGLWDNGMHIDGWCLIATSGPQGSGNTWVAYTYQNKADNTQTATVIWPAGWPAPAENINGQLPSNFFTGSTSATATSGTTAVANAMVVNSIEVLYQVYDAPTSQPTYKAAGECV